MKKLVKHVVFGTAATIVAGSAGVAAMGTAVNASVVVGPLAVLYIYTHDKEDLNEIKHRGKKIFKRFKT